MDREKMAKELFLEGYNCAQSVFGAFCDVMNMDQKSALRLSSSFGGGMGRLREVCGAVSGMFMVAGALYGYDDPKDQDIKAEHYARIQYLAKEFQKQNQSIICRELLGLEGTSSNPVPEVRTAEYYERRPCIDLVGDAARIMEKYILEVNKMKIAVTYENGEIFQHFGHTEQFKIYEVTDGIIISSEIIPTMGNGHGALAEFLKKQEVDALICGGIGGGAKMALDEAGIKLYSGVSQDADQAIEDMLNNRLSNSTEATCNHHHEEEHNCGEHSCGTH